MSGKQEEKKPVAVTVPSEEPKKQGKKKGKDDAPNQPSDEDIQIKADVELLVTRIGDVNPQLSATALDTLITMLRTHHGSVASIPKPLKFVRTLFSQLEATVEGMSNEDNKRRLHDLMSFIAMTLDAKNIKESALVHKLKGTRTDLSAWGHEYLRFLAGEVATEWENRDGKNTEELQGFVDQIVAFMLHHQDESTALDLLMEIEEITNILQHVDENNYHRIGQYLVAVSAFLTAPTNKEVLKVAYDLYVKQQQFPQALRVALYLRDRALVSTLFESCDNAAVKIQMAFVCGRYRMFFDFDDDETLADVNGNRKLSELFRHSAKELDSLAPKSAEEVFKTQLDSKPNSASSHMHNLASLMVSGMANAGFGKDTVLSQEGTTCLYQTKDHRMTAATAALGLIHLWDEGDGLAAVDKYTYSDENYIKAGAYLATGLTMCGVKSAFDAAFGLLAEHVHHANREVRIGAILGLGFAYAGTEKMDVKELLIPILADSEQPLEVQCFAAYAAALVFPGSCDEDLVENCLSCLMEKDEKQLLEPCVRYLILALGSFFLCRMEHADALLDMTQTLSPVIQQYAEVVIRSCAYAGSGNVLEAQRMFHLVAEVEEADEDEAKEGNSAAAAASSSGAAPTTGDGAQGSTGADEAAAPVAATAEEKPNRLNHKAAAVLGISMIALGEDLGTEMAKRSLIHLLLADTVSKKDIGSSGRRAVPLAYAMLGISTASMPIVETLNRLSHDGDIPTAMNAILGMGLVAAGTTNARVATMLRQLAQYYHKEKDSDVLFTVRLSQGLTALGKGHVTLSPLQQDRNIISPSALVGLLGLVHSALDLKGTILDRYHYMFYSFTSAVNARMILAVDSNMSPIPNGVTVRVGQPVDTVTVAGKPRGITGFQTHNTPVLLSDSERSELAPGKYRTFAAVVEGVIVVEEKPQTTE